MLNYLPVNFLLVTTVANNYYRTTASLSYAYIVRFCVSTVLSNVCIRLAGVENIHVFNFPEHIDEINSTTEPLEHESFHSTLSSTDIRRWLHHKPSLLDALLITGTTLSGQRARYDFVVYCLHKNIRYISLSGYCSCSLLKGSFNL
jgi:hypothetical protein